MTARHEIAEWIVGAALAGTDEVDILAGICERMNAGSLSLVRASVATDLLDPTFDARSVRWLRQQGGVEETFPRRDDAAALEDWHRSPFFFLVENRQRMLRRRLDATYCRGEFPLIDRLQDEGATDYVAFASRVGRSLRLGEGEGIVASWTTDARDGFTEAQIESLAGILPALALAIMLRMTNRAARTLITTYLGRDAAERVLAGNIVRGRADPIRAVVWHSDLVGFTRISDTTSAETVLALLNDYAEAQVEEIEAHDGHVLKFIGDGILAIFPHDDTALACKRALDAAAGLRQRIAALNARRAASALPVTDTHVALHIGELLYGNLGSPRRLDFTVLGPAVNEAARIEALCASLEQAIIVSSAFAEAAGDARDMLVSLGRYAMKGVTRPQELFTVDLA
ncbi:MAG TPA: adenylate/guanylate cyclase domain-containing protein [Casimicrobiaceae bacterium]|nr:adenylate/guanylate cyclase domain-containing protein [Casimicrobiaceae bacterium]